MATRIESAIFPYREAEGTQVELNIQTFPTRIAKQILDELIQIAYGLSKPLIQSFISELLNESKKAKDEGKKFNLANFDFATLDLENLDISGIMDSLIEYIISEDSNDLIYRILIDSSIKINKGAKSEFLYFKNAQTSDFDYDVYDDVFSGDLSLIFNCVKSILEANFKDFLFIFSRGMKKKVALETVKSTLLTRKKTRS